VATPWASLSGRIAAAAGEGPAPNVVQGPAPMVSPDAIVIRPDEPWMENAGGFGHGTERWVAVAAVPAADSVSGMARLYDLAHLVQEAASDEGWDWTTVGSLTLDESTGAPLLVCPIRLTYKPPKS
jgi:hypothetical protein